MNRFITDVERVKISLGVFAVNHVVFQYCNFRVIFFIADFYYYLSCVNMSFFIALIKCRTIKEKVYFNVCLSKTPTELWPRLIQIEFNKSLSSFNEIFLKK